MPPSESKPKKRKRFHKRKVKENVSESTEEFFSRKWDPDKTKDRGIWCGNCRKRTPWTKLGVEYGVDKAEGYIFRAWFCTCGQQVREDHLVDIDS